MGSLRLSIVVPMIIDEDDSLELELIVFHSVFMRDD